MSVPASSIERPGDWVSLRRSPDFSSGLQQARAACFAAKRYTVAQGIAMTMFDWYEPQPALACPVCGQPLHEWQGYDGPCGLLVWRQGLAAAIAQRVDGEVRWSDDERQRRRLPAAFCISSVDCGCPFPVEAIGRTEQGLWTRTELVTAATAHQRPQERRATFQARLRWLQNKRNA